MSRKKRRITLPPTELWSELDYYESDKMDLPSDDKVTSLEGNEEFWQQFETTPVWTRNEKETKADDELAESLEFKRNTSQFLKEAFMGNNDHVVHRARSKYIAEQLGLVNDESDPILLEKAHQAYYLAFRFADMDFTMDSSEVEGVFNQRALTVEEFGRAAVYARERLDTDPEWERKLYTSLSLFTETPEQRRVASAVFSMATLEIAHWEVDQSSIGEVKRLGIWHLRKRFGALAAEAAELDPSWAKKINRFEANMRPTANSSRG